MLKKQEDCREQIEFFSLDQLVPEDHLVRKLDAAIDFNFIYDEVKDLYGDVGRGSIDPVALIKIVLVQYMFGIKSMRQTIKELQVNFAYKWFCGFGITEKVPHFSTFGKNYVRRFERNDIFEKIFNRILERAIECGFVDTKAVFMDSTHIKASANKKKKIEKYVQTETKNYQKTLEKEINAERVKDGKKEFEDKDDNDMHKITQSTTDPEAGEFHKGEHEKMFAYSAHTVCDRHAFVLDFEVTPANVHDSTMFSSLYKKTLDRFDFDYIALDAGYKTPAIAKEILDSGKTPLMPYTCPKSKTKKNFEYNSYYDYYTCALGNILEYTTTTREGYRQYKSNAEMCSACPNRETCMSEKSKQRLLTRHLWQKYIDEVNKIRLTPIWKELYKERSETIERVFGTAKESHAMRYTQVRGKKKVRLQVLLTFSCMNLKKLASWLWKTTKPKSLLRKICSKIHQYFNLLQIFTQKSRQTAF